DRAAGLHRARRLRDRVARQPQRQPLPRDGARDAVLRGRRDPAVVLDAALPRRRRGSSLQAIRDDEDAAASVGVRVVAGKRILFLLAATGAGVAGAMTLANTLFIEPTAIFSVNYTAYMIFMVLVGGLGTFEGPIIGAVVLYLIQQWFGNDGVWYLVGLGGAAMAFALLLPRGVWGTLEERTGLRFMPVGYRVGPAA